MSKDMRCKCGYLADYEYKGEYYCDECILDELEQAGLIESHESYECSYKIYFDANENYIGDSYEDTQEVIESCLKDIPELRWVD